MVAIMDPVATRRAADAKSGTVTATFRVMPILRSALSTTPGLRPCGATSDDDLDRVIRCRNLKGTLGSSWIESVVAQRQLDFAHEEPYARKEPLGPRR